MLELAVSITCVFVLLYGVYRKGFEDGYEKGYEKSYLDRESLLESFMGAKNADV